MVLAKIARRIRLALPYLENPQLRRLHHQGGMVETYLKLNQPWFQRHGFTTVLDIGANVGQFALTVAQLLPKAQIFAFEPIPSCFNQLQQAMGSCQNFTALNLGLGDERGELAFECNDYTPSSSFLTMTNVHTEAFPFTQGTAQIKVKIEQLDTIAQNLALTEPLLIKIDVQGYEDRVLRGGEQTVRRARMLIVETSFQSLYQNQPLFKDIYQVLTDWGFSYVGALDQLPNPKTGEILQSDSIFVQRNP
ncbi:FkbM family methyltransferase [Candidatus Cyanaurora vandensis]|uniref:FkbM family methyltransferase n=2 Tax=Candidatus Cyanaurora vandensis TaxID=2714958 RepID=UPI00257C909D|nr:FkbM family methyltransferase [Candidatus Cyanaurora vandensis]